MHPQKLSVLAFSLLFLVCVRLDGGSFLLEELGGVELWSIPQESPGEGLLATTLELRASDPDATLVTFTNFQLLGRPHQAWVEGPFGVPTPRKELTARRQVYAEDWVAFDSHMLLSLDMLGGQAGNGFWSFTETNDSSTTESIGATLSKVGVDGTFGARTGFGEITAPDHDTIASYLRPEFQANAFPFAYVVGKPGEVYFTLGVLGVDIIDAGVVGGAAFGYFGNEPVSVFPIPEPRIAVWMGIVLLLTTRRRVLAN